MKFKRIIILLIVSVLIISFSGCTSMEDNSMSTIYESENIIDSEQENNSSVIEDTKTETDLFSNRDKETGYDEDTSVLITLDDEKIDVNSNNVKINGSIVTITDEGSYILRGNLSDGQIVIDAEKTDKLQIVLDNVKINNSSSAPIYVKQADKVFITMSNSSNNTLSTTGEFVAIDEENIDAVIYSKEDITLNGAGILNITTQFGHGVISNDDLVFTSGNYKITSSGKGISGKDSVKIGGGNFNINSIDDSIHSDGDVIIIGGEFEISSEDDGIHADSNVSIMEGKVNILNSYEGIEGQSIDIVGGNISLIASDDGLNSSGGNDGSGIMDMSGKGSFATDKNCYIKISGGTVNVNAKGDGIDSNGNLYIVGGETYVSGPTNNGNGSLDYNGTAEITGGIFIAAGSSGMAQNFGNSSTQGSILVNIANTTNGTISLKDSNDKELVTFTPEKEYSSVVISTPDIKKGETYKIDLGSDSQTIEMTNLIYGEGGINGGHQGEKFRPEKSGEFGVRPDGIPNKQQP